MYNLYLLNFSLCMYNLVQILKLKINECFMLSLHPPHRPAQCQVQRHKFFFVQPNTIPVISVPQAHLHASQTLQNGAPSWATHSKRHWDSCVLPPFSFIGLLSKLTSTSLIAAMSLASLNDDSWLVALAILGRHHPVFSTQTSGPAFPQHHPDPAWTHWPNHFLGHMWVKCLVLLWK